MNGGQKDIRVEHLQQKWLQGDVVWCPEGYQDVGHLRQNWLQG